MKINLPQLSNAPDGTVCFDYNMDLRDVEVNFGKPFREPVNVRGSVRDGAGMVRLTAVISAGVFTSCARCSKRIRYDKQTPISFTLARTLDDEDIDDIWLVDSDIVELDDIFVPELILSMEMSALCSDDCRGLCPKCGADLNEGDCGCDRREIDPRLAKLADYLNQL